MGFMGSIFKVLGFESEEKIKTKKIKTKASYKLNKNNSNRIDQIDGVSVYYPENLSQAKEFIDFVKQKKAIIISTESCEKDSGDKLLSFLEGFCYGSNARIISLEEDKLYLILPEGMEVEE